MLILASSSPVRLEILCKFGLKPTLVISPNINEEAKNGESPRMLSLRLAKEKGAEVAKNYKDAIIISADTVVCRGRKVIEKCQTKEDVKNALLLLSGRGHKIFTSVCVTKGLVQKCKTVETKVKFKHLTQKEIEEFVQKGEGIGKAGGYSIGGMAESFITQICGSISGTAGLPSLQTFNLLKSFGLSI